MTKPGNHAVEDHAVVELVLGEEHEVVDGDRRSGGVELHDEVAGGRSRSARSTVIDVLMVIAGAVFHWSVLTLVAVDGGQPSATASALALAWRAASALDTVVVVTSWS